MIHLKISFYLALKKTQRALHESLMAGDFVEFKRAIRHGADVNLRDHRSEYSTFELACTMPGKKSFLTACLCNKANVSKCNPVTKQYPIHLAALSFDYENVSTLLDFDSSLVDQKFEDHTALSLLFAKINYDTHEKGFACIQVLLENHAEINVTDKDLISPIAHIVQGNEPWRKMILDYCLNKCSLMVHDRVRRKIETFFPGTEIPVYDMEKVTVEIMRAKLSNGSEEEFTKVYGKYCDQNHIRHLPERECKELINVAVSRAKLSSAKTLIEHRLKNGQFEGDTKVLSGLLEKCCFRGEQQLLEWLLAIIPKENDKLVNEDPLLSQLVKRMGLNIDKTKCPYFKCMTILLKDARIELDKLDHTNSTALHYAVQYKIEHAQELLLKNGAYIGAQNIFNELPITNMDPDLLEKHLDTCISNNIISYLDSSLHEAHSRNRRIPGDEDYGVIIDYKNFIPPTLKTTDTEQQDTCKNEMRPINDIAQSPSLKRLLRHPVISSILLLKWQKLSWVFYTQLFTSLANFMLFTMYVLFYDEQDDSRGLQLFFWWSSMIGWLYLISRPCIAAIQWLCNMLASQDHLSKCECKSFENFIKLLLIIAFGTVLLHELDEEWWRGLSSFVILLAAIEVLFLTGTLPVLSLSTYMTIMAKVSKNYLKCLMLYSTILLAFALSFYTLFHEKDRTQSEGSRSENATSATSQDANNQIKWFGNLPLAFFKTAVMSFGELEASNMHFQYSIVSYIVFAVFIFIVPMVLFNLMNGLAVNDTTEIRSEAEIITMTQRAFYIYKKEIAARTFRSFRCLNNKFWDMLLSLILVPKSLQLFENDTQIDSIAVMPNQRNAIMYWKRVKAEANQLHDNKKWSKCGTKMDDETVKYALEILHPSKKCRKSPIEYLTRIEQLIQRLNVIEAEPLNKTVQNNS